MNLPRSHSVLPSNAILANVGVPQRICRLHCPTGMSAQVWPKPRPRRCRSAPPAYRQRYKEFLKIDFPRVPYPTDKNQFRKLVALGSELRTLHLLESPTLNTLITGYPQTGDNTITDAKNRLGKIHINQTQYFTDIPGIAWNFHIGGYQPAQKWLKDRKNRTLNHNDITHYQKIIVALTETDRLMGKIDTVLVL